MYFGVKFNGIHFQNTHTHTVRLTCAHHHRLDELAGVEAGLDDVRATEQGVSLVLLRAEGRVLLGVPVALHRVGQVGLGDRDALPCSDRDERREGPVVKGARRACV